MEKLCYLGDTTGAIGGAFDNALTRIRSGWCKLKDLVLLLASRYLALGAKGRLYSACVRSVMLYGNVTWPVKEKDVIRLQRNDARMVRWKCSVRPEDSFSTDEPMARLKLKNMWECLLDRRQ